jgi:hypothetical protein
MMRYLTKNNIMFSLSLARLFRRCDTALLLSRETTVTFNGVPEKRTVLPICTIVSYCEASHRSA